MVMDLSVSRFNLWKWSIGLLYLVQEVTNLYMINITYFYVIDRPDESRILPFDQLIL